MLEDDGEDQVHELTLLSYATEFANSTLNDRRGRRLEAGQVREAVKELSLLRDKTEQLEASLSDRLGHERALTRLCLKENDDPDSLLLPAGKVAEIAVNEIYGDHVANDGSVYDKKGGLKSVNNPAPIFVPLRNARTDILGNKLLLLLRTSKDLIQSCGDLLNDSSRLSIASQTYSLENADEIVQNIRDANVFSEEEAGDLNPCEARDIKTAFKGINGQRLGVGAMRGGEPDSEDSLLAALDTTTIPTAQHPQPYPDLPRIVLHKDKIRQSVFGTDPWEEPNFGIPQDDDDYNMDHYENSNKTKEDVWLLEGGDIPISDTDDDEPTPKFKQVMEQTCEGFNESLQAFCDRQGLDLKILNSARRRLEYIRNLTALKQGFENVPWHVKETWRRNKTARYEFERAIEVKHFRQDMFEIGYPEDGPMSKEEAARILDRRDQSEVYRYLIDEILPLALISPDPEQVFGLNETLRAIFSDKPRFGGLNPELVYPDDPDAWHNVLGQEELTGQTQHPLYPRNFFYPKGYWSCRIPNSHPLLPAVNSRTMRKVMEKARTMAVKVIEERKKKEADLKAMSERFDNITKDPEVLPDSEEARKLEILLRWNITRTSELNALVFAWIFAGSNFTESVEPPTEDDERLEVTIPLNPYWRENLTQLLRDGADINHHNPDIFDFTPMHVACSRGNLSVIEYVRELGADLEGRSENGGTPLHHSAFDGQTDVVGKLLELGAEVNALNSFSQTALHTACMCGHNETAAVLVEAGVDVNVRDSEGNLAIDLVEHQINRKPVFYEGLPPESSSKDHLFWLRDFLRSRQSDASAPMTDQ